MGTVKPCAHILTRRQLLASGLAAASVCGVPAMAATMPSIQTTLLDGQPFSTEQAVGKVLLVNFWATWCGPCREEMPAIDAYYQKYRDRGLLVLALSTDDLKDEPKVRELAKAFSFRVGMLKTSKITGLGRIWRMPVSAVFDRQGGLVKQDWFVEAGLSAATLNPVIQPLL